MCTFIHATKIKSTSLIYAFYGMSFRVLSWQKKNWAFWVFMALNDLKQKRHRNILMIEHSISIKFAYQTIGRIFLALIMWKNQGVHHGALLGPSLTNRRRPLIKSELFFFNIYNASALKRITANQLGCNVYQPLKFHLFYYVRAMLKRC